MTLSHRDSFHMLHRLLEKLNPNSPANLFVNITKLLNLHQGPQETGTDFMACVKGLYISLTGNKLEDIMHYFALAGLDDTQYGELVDDFHCGDPKILSSDIW